MTVQKRCECGIIVQGKSEKHLEHNLKQHKKSKTHNLLMDIHTQMKGGKLKHGKATENIKGRGTGI